MAAETIGTSSTDAPFTVRLAEASTAVAGLAAAADRLAEVADADVAAVMDELTTLAGQLNGLRVAVAGQVRDRALWRQRGASSLTGWLRADPRTADEAWALSRLAAHPGRRRGPVGAPAPRGRRAGHRRLRGTRRQGRPRRHPHQGPAVGRRPGLPDQPGRPHPAQPCRAQLPPVQRPTVCSRRA